MQINVFDDERLITITEACFYIEEKIGVKRTFVYTHIRHEKNFQKCIRTIGTTHFVYQKLLKEYIQAIINGEIIISD